MIQDASEERRDKHDRGRWRRALGDDPMDKVLSFTLAILFVGLGLMFVGLIAVGLWALLWSYPLAFLLLMLLAYPLWRVICRVQKYVEDI